MMDCPCAKSKERADLLPSCQVFTIPLLPITAFILIKKDTRKNKEKGQKKKIPGNLFARVQSAGMGEEGPEGSFLLRSSPSSSPHMVRCPLALGLCLQQGTDTPGDGPLFSLCWSRLCFPWPRVPRCRQEWKSLLFWAAGLPGPSKSREQ